MKIFLKKIKLLTIFTFVCLFFSLTPKFTKPANAAALCTTSPTSGVPGNSITITTTPGGAFGNINIQAAFPPNPVINVGFLAAAPGPTTFAIPNINPGLYAVRIGALGAACDDLSINAPGGPGGSGLFGTKINLGAFFSPASAFANFGALASRIIIILTSFVGAASLIFIVIAGIKFVTSSGDPKQIASARATLTYAFVGLIVAILAFVILQVVQYFLGASVPI